MAHGHGRALRRRAPADSRHTRSRSGTSVRTFGRTALVAALAVGLVACSGDDDDDTAGGGGDDAEAATGQDAALPDGWDGYESETYADDANWLCRPGMDGDACTAEDLDATAVDAAGALEPAPHEVAQDPPVDCFYV